MIVPTEAKICLLAALVNLPFVINGSTPNAMVFGAALGVAVVMIAVDTVRGN